MSPVAERGAGGATREVSAPRPAADALHAVVRQMLGAERRLRGREHAPGGLTHAHIRSLHALSEAGEMTAGQLARSAELNPASVTAMLDHLEGLGIVTRTRSQTDRRVTNVALTPKGAGLLAEKTARWRALWRERLAGFDDAELESAGRVIGALAALFDAVVVESEAERAGG